IVGFTHRRGERDKQIIRRATGSLLHRGPDHQGFYQSASISLGAARLRILDLQSADQPLISRDGDTVLAFNGEIVNHRELRRTLEGHGHVFHSRSDSEVVLRAFLEWGKGCLPLFRGMFAFAVWMESRKRLLIARDRVGIKPLYLYHAGRELYFASEIKALLEHPGVERVLDHRALEYYLSLHYVPTPLTLLENIEKLPPGHVLEWIDGEAHSEPYWE